MDMLTYNILKVTELQIDAILATEQQNYASKTQT